MPLRFTHTRLLVNHYQACFLFYRDIIGLMPEWGDENSGYCDFKTGEVRLALFGRADMAATVGRATAPNPTGIQDTVALIFAVDDVDAEYERLGGLGITFVTPPTDRKDWAIRTAHFRDPDGNLIEINQPLSQ